MQSPKVSLVIPVRNEADSIDVLLESIERQTVQPDEIIIVDGGSTDKTLEILAARSAGDEWLKLIAVDEATPGKGRNIGIDAAKNEWIALTDAGIRLDETWLAELTANCQNADIVYGNYAPELSSPFSKDKKSLFLTAATIAYVPAQRPGKIRSMAIASYLLRKEVWEAVGGFPDLRAAEDLMFMEQAKQLDFKSATAPKAMMYWSLRPDVASTFAKFRLYSKHNVWADRQWDWHYGIARQYAVMLPFVLLGIIHSFWWLIAFPVWLAARTIKRAAAYWHELGGRVLFDPRVLSITAFLILVIDAATFAGWFEAAIKPKNDTNG